MSLTKIFVIVLVNRKHCAASLRTMLSTMPRCNGVGTNFGVGVEEERPEGPRAEDGVLGEGTASPSSPTRGVAGAL